MGLTTVLADGNQIMLFSRSELRSQNAIVLDNRTSPTASRGTPFYCRVGKTSALRETPKKHFETAAY